MNTRTEPETLRPHPAVPDRVPRPAPAGRRAGFRLLALVAQREIVTQLRRGEFWASLAIMILVVGASVGTQVLFAGGVSEHRVTAVPGNAGLHEALARGGRVTVEPSPSDADSEASVRAGDVDLAVLGDGSAVYLDRLPPDLADALRVAAADAAARAALAAQGMDQARIDQLLAGGQPRIRALDPEGNRTAQRTVLAVVGVGAVFMLMFVFGQGIAQGVREEKSSRVVEVLLAKVNARQLLGGKVLGLGLVVLVQMLVLVLAGFLAALGLDLIAVPADAAEIGLLVLLWFLPGFLMFATLWALAGALVSRPEDVNNAAGPVSALMSVGLLGAMFPYSGVAPEVGAALSLLPGFSWSMMPVRMAAGAVPWWQVGVAMALLALAVAVLLRVAGQIYVGGLLSGGGVLKARAALRAARESGLS